jgi:N-acetylmuramoyl-L-alanine amidase
VFYGKDDSKDFAKEMQGVLNDEFNLPDVKRDFSALYADKYLLTESPCSAVIIECGFLSNPIDTQNLLDEKYLHRLAYTIFQGIAVWWSKST